MRWKPHVRFGGRTGETDLLKGRHRAPVRSHCGATTFLEADHIHAFADHGPTTFHNLVRPCHFHHGLKTNAGYVVYQDKKGDWHFDPPPPFGQEPDLGGEPGAGRSDPIRDGRSQTTDPGDGDQTSEPPPGPTSKPRAGPRRQYRPRRSSTPGNDADPGESPPLFDLGE
ncbi:MAG TPA: hypothetical protein VHZ02_00870 [Acidimicrobiales bacterium]|nr:hypothetical protein [Acidimicrobiales bacterium]